MVNNTVAAIISFIIPGLGQIIQGEKKDGSIFLIIWIILMSIFLIIPRHTTYSGIIGIIILIIMCYAAYNAYSPYEL